MTRHITQPLLMVLGVLLVVAGQCTIGFREVVTPAIVNHVGPIGQSIVSFGEGMFPAGVVLGIVAVFIGALLVAQGIGQPSWRSRALPSARRSLQPAMRRRVIALLSVAALLAVVTTVPGLVQRWDLWPVFVWLLAAFVGGCAMLLVDRARGTSLGNPFPDRREWMALPALVALDTAWIAYDLSHWVWSGFPDESDFFGVAKSMVLGLSQRPLLSEHGVFEYHPVLSSYYQSLFMDVFGADVFGWRLSSAAALSLSLPFLYLFGRELWNRRVGFMAAIFFGFAQLAVAFAHFGYNNVQVYPIVSAALGIGAWAHRRASLTGHYLTGWIAGVGFYSYYVARVTMPLLVLLAWCLHGFPLSRKNRPATAALSCGLLLPLMPWLMHVPTALRNMLHVASVTGGAGVTWLGIAARTLQHWVWSMLYGLWYPSPHHFLENPVVDPVCAALAVIGVWLCVRSARRSAGARFLLLTYVLAALLVGSTSPHFRPPLTRLLFLSPFTALLAAVAAETFLRRVAGGARWHARIAQVCGAVLVSASVAWNVIALHHSVYDLHHGYGPGTTTEVVRMARQLPVDCRLVYVQGQEAENPSADTIADEYRMRERFRYFRSLEAPAVEFLRTMSPPFAVFADLRNPQEAQALETILRERFPEHAWRATDAGRPWSLRYLYVPAGSLPRSTDTSP